jgi:hypothetical protein
VSNVIPARWKLGKERSYLMNSEEEIN